MEDKTILRELAGRYFDMANSEQNRRNILRHKRANDKKGDRPVVLIDEIPWHEMNMDGELDLLCQDPLLRQAEAFFRTRLYQWKHMPADMAVPPYFIVRKKISTTGIGLTRMESEHEQSALSHTFVDQLQTEEDLEKLHFETISYDESGTLREYNRFGEIFGDVLPVKIAGEPCGYGLSCKTLDDIVFFRGLNRLFYDLVDRPDFMHRLIGKMTDIFLDKVRQYEALNLLDSDSYYCHCTAALTDDLHPKRDAVRARDTWGRGLAQIFASVSPEMHDEFDIQYMIRAMEPFGLVYYGCCEPLDQKIHILEKIPNLRKISITPWADIDHAAEIIQNRYVIASKPNPSALALGHLDEDAVRAELTRILKAFRRNGCSGDIVLKDITTVGGNPGCLFAWHRIAMELVESL